MLNAKGKAQGRALWFGAVLLTAVLLAGFAGPILREFASFLITEDSLEPAEAIVVLGGHLPFREMEAARLYRANWAPVVVIVREAPNEESQALQELGVEVKEGWQIRREILMREGVPSSAIRVVEGEAGGTLEELQAVVRALKFKNRPVILVTSKYHTRRARLTWKYVTEGRSKAIVRATGQDPFDPTRWWHERRFVLSVVREYLGLINYYAGFPVGTHGS